VPGGRLLSAWVSYSDFNVRVQATFHFARVIIGPWIAAAGDDRQPWAFPADRSDDGTQRSRRDGLQCRHVMYRRPYGTGCSFTFPLQSVGELRRRIVERATMPLPSRMRTISFCRESQAKIQQIIKNRQGIELAAC
jgi:hypothetical protein